MRPAEWLRPRLRELLRPGARRDRLDNEHLRLLLAFTLAPDSNCIDVGAHRGDVLREIVRLAPAGRHIAYEPVPDSHAALAREFPQVDVRRAALSNEAGETSFVHVRSDPAFSGLRERDYPREFEREMLTVRTEALDAVLPEDYAPRLIKIDVEGAEGLVLEGAIGTLRRHRPVVAFEHGVGGPEHYGTRPADVYRLLVDEAGLRIFDIDGNGPYRESEFDDVFDKWMWNFVAHA